MVKIVQRQNCDLSAVSGLQGSPSETKLWKKPHGQLRGCSAIRSQFALFLPAAWLVFVPCARFSKPDSNVVSQLAPMVAGHGWHLAGFGFCFWGWENWIFLLFPCSTSHNTPLECVCVCLGRLAGFSPSSLTRLRDGLQPFVCPLFHTFPAGGIGKPTSYQQCGARSGEFGEMNFTIMR